ncbi:zinc finger MYM-type protein 6-like [Belonocnema kinseyi]|uniref:zinc finger MYM-type protein 6-like n=1 Tax=Belonocnema kinseyi TaxID=2817044 RepID=UPI00143D6633|nr:zinc finger MYM-type protein 6-like [Belonocnema kinseyi]
MSDYLQYGLRMKESGDPQCLICLKVFTVSLKSPSKMKRHFERIHPESQNLPVEVFETKLRELEFLEGKVREMLGSESTVEDNEDLRLRRKLCECSYAAALAIARAGKPQTEVGTLISPICAEWTRILWGDKKAQIIENISHSARTIDRRITELGIDMRGQLKNELNSSEIFAIQVDGSTDVSNVEQLLGFVRFIGKKDIEERMLFCKSMEGQATGHLLFQGMMEKTAFF